MELNFDCVTNFTDVIDECSQLNMAPYFIMFVHKLIKRFLNSSSGDKCVIGGMISQLLQKLTN